MNWKEFRPTTLFLVKFLGIYIVGNLLYGLYVTAYEPLPDPATKWVTNQSAWMLTSLGWDSQTYHHAARPTTSILYKARAVVSVYEGCNGINVIIIFLAFLAAFGPVKKVTAGFAVVGILVIHGINLLRIMLLFFVTLYVPDFLYFTHKYLFTAIIYAVVFAMWIIWVRTYSRHRESA